MPPAVAAKLRHQRHSPRANPPTDPPPNLRFQLALFERVLNEAWGNPAGKHLTATLVTGRRHHPPHQLIASDRGSVPVFVPHVALGTQRGW